MKTKYFHTILVILISILSLNIYLVNSSRKTSKQKYLQDNPPPYYFYIKTNYMAYFQNELLLLNNSRVYLGNDTISSYNLLDNTKGTFLVFRFSGESCNTCIDFIISQLKAAFNNYSENNQILLVGSELNPRVKESFYGKKVLSFSDKNFGLPLEKYNTPFLMVIDSTKMSKMVFIPDKAFPDITEAYLKNIKEKFFK